MSSSGYARHLPMIDAVRRAVREEEAEVPINAGNYLFCVSSQ